MKIATTDEKFAYLDNVLIPDDAGELDAKPDAVTPDFLEHYAPPSPDTPVVEVAPAPWWFLDSINGDHAPTALEYIISAAQTADVSTNGDREQWIRRIISLFRLYDEPTRLFKMPSILEMTKPAPLGLKTNEFKGIIKALDKEAAEAEKERKKKQLHEPYLVLENDETKGAQFADRYYNPLANCLVWITSVVRWIRGQADEDKETVFKVRGVTWDGVQLRDTTVRGEDFFSPAKWIVNAWGFKARIAPGKAQQFCDAVMWYTDAYKKDEVNHEEIITYTGWYNYQTPDGDYKRVYITKGGAVGHPHLPVNSQFEDIQLDMFDLPVEPLGGPEPMKVSLELLDKFPAEYIIPLWSMIWLSLIQSVPELAPDFAVTLLGETGCFKSGLSALVQRHFGARFRYNRWALNWGETTMTIEVRMASAEAMIVIDNFKPGGTRAERSNNAKLFTNVLHNIGDRASRGRRRPDGTAQKQWLPLCAPVITAELLAGTQSVEGRMFTVRVQKGRVQKKELIDWDRAHPPEKQMLGHATAGAICWLERSWDTIIAGAKATLRQLQDELHPDRGHARLDSNAAKLMVGFSLGMSYAVRAGAITEDEAQQRITAARSTITRLMLQQADAMMDATPMEMFRKTFLSLLNTGAIYLRHRDIDEEGAGINTIPDSTVWQGHGTRVGFYDAEKLYFDSTAVHREIYKFREQIGKPFEFDERAMLNHLADNEWIDVQSITRKDGSHYREFSKKTTVAGIETRPRLVHLYRAKLMPETCPQCSSTDVKQHDDLYVCTACQHEWRDADEIPV